MTGSIDRREFVATCAVLCAGALGGCVSMVTHPMPVADGRMRISLARYPELSARGGALKVLPAGATDPVYVLATDNGFTAVSPICTHRGCTVDVNGERLVCPCHGSTYDREGRVLKGPAQRALQRFPVRRSADDLIIELVS